MNLMSDPTPATLTEVPAKGHRRVFTAEYKKRIVSEADGCKESGSISALLRREGLYSSRLTAWRLARERGDLAGATKPRGPEPKPAPDARDRRITELERENTRLEIRARRAEAMVELQKKVSQLMETVLTGDLSGNS
jgi:transposase-like protein